MEKLDEKNSELQSAEVEVQKQRRLLVCSGSVLIRVGFLFSVSTAVWTLAFFEDWGVTGLVVSALMTGFGLLGLILTRYLYVFVNTEPGEISFRGFYWEEKISFARKKRPARVAMIQKDARYLIPLKTDSRLKVVGKFFISRIFRKRQDRPNQWSNFVIFYIRNPETRQTRRVVLPALNSRNQDVYRELAEMIHAAGIPLRVQTRLWPQLAPQVGHRSGLQLQSQLENAADMLPSRAPKTGTGV